ncbi:hypothetical protein HYT52_00675 [Candidatus Woesearchaeota archaeon]|nr:hypothetical protein [Candidatus Woesearchaeota archaeon]
MTKNNQTFSWDQLWAGKWGLQFTSIDGVLYTKNIKEEIGKKFTDAIMIADREGVSCFLPTVQLNKIGKHFAKRIKNIQEAKRWCRRVMEETDAIFKLIDRLKQKSQYDYEDYKRLVDATFSHVPPNFVIKKAADYLDEERLGEYLLYFSRARTYTEPVYDEVDYVLKRIVKVISKLENVAATWMRYITHDEVKNYFEKGILPPLDILRKREKGCALWFHDGKCTFYFGKEFRRIKNKMIITYRGKVIKGATAYPGRIRGIARVVFDPHRVNVFNSGDILVTGMTRPEYLPLMKKSAGFVTDAGGILSHAAIVARELKKPCVIGTIVGTKKIKDGMKVEVDADKGIVKIIS